MPDPVSQATIARITGYTRRDCQARALRQMGINHRINPKGEIIVIDTDLPLSSPSENNPVRLNLDAAQA